MFTYYQGIVYRSIDFNSVEDYKGVDIDHIFDSGDSTCSMW